ncbi:unnamed protein product [Adineta steineri]|uniref:DUF4139 domain-containing protein n=1 Tax=Adineta steineri TaxID=433720 RepID=A0A815V028_9BILA|nr:unnamed protein product [Adineta steineri]CAF1650344.1 unnamed protein product [Adineta steineri]
MNIISFFLSIIIIKVIISKSINNPHNGIHIKIYDNIAEITQPISAYEDLPMTFSPQEWSTIRSDSFRLIGNCINPHAQIISFNKTSLNGKKVLIQRNINNDTYTEGIMIDETRNLIQDLIDNTYYTITNDRIRYLSIPPIQNYSVDFVLETYSNEQLYVRYLQNNIKWKVHYDLLLESNDSNSILQAYATIQNNRDSSLTIDFAELISGDINIQSSSNNNGEKPVYAGSGNGYGDLNGASPVSVSNDYVVPSIGDAEELVGVYLFRINETFILDSRSKYILPMFCPIIDIERYGSIEKYFLSIDNFGNAQRSYRLRIEETFLPAGKVFIRESDRLVGETSWSDIAANETNEFNLGQDPDLQYIENIQLNSRRNIYQGNSFNNYTIILSTYTIDLHLINNKQRSINIEYRLKFSSQDNLTLKENVTNDSIQIDGSSLTGLFELNANDKQQVTFTFETQ